jgi:hypothetical protein
MPRPLLALAVSLVAAVPATAAYITPDSIVRPPPTTYPGVAGTPVAESDYVTTQYAGLGVVFPLRVLTPNVTYATAIASVNGVNVWAGVLRYDTGGGATSSLTMDALGNVTGDFIHATSSVAVDFVWEGSALGILSAFRADGSTEDAVLDAGTGTYRLSLGGGGFTWFSASVTPDLGDVGTRPFAWGVAGVEIPGAPTPTAPEPGALALAVTGMLGLATLYARSARANRFRFREAADIP